MGVTFSIGLCRVECSLLNVRLAGGHMARPQVLRSFGYLLTDRAPYGHEPYGPQM